MNRISRHDIPGLERVNESFALYRDRIETRLAKWQRRTKNLDLALNDLLRVARCGSVAEPGSEHIRRTLMLAAEASAGIFVGVSESDVPPTLGGVPIAEIERSDGSVMHCSRWIPAFFLNCLCRSDRGLDILCGVPVEVLRNSSTRTAGFRGVFAEALRGFWTTQPETGSLLIKAMEFTDPDKYDVGNDEWVLHFDTHHINLMAQVINQDERFEAALAHALELHKLYWSKTRERRQDSAGYISIELLGIAALAYEKGLHFEIDSEYLPMNLVRSDAWVDSP